MGRLSCVSTINMNSLLAFALVTMVAGGAADHGAPLAVVGHGHGGGFGGHGGHGSYAPPHYTFEYGVDAPGSQHGGKYGGYTGPLHFGHTENKDGYSTKGHYYVDLPDGRRQVVNYHVADEYSGYVADVKYETGHGGHAPVVHAAGYGGHGGVHH